MPVEPVAVAKPLLLITTFVTSEELHVTCDVRFTVDWSLNVPVAVNCWVEPTGIVALEGVTVIDVRVAGVTVKNSGTNHASNVAVMVAGEPTDDSPVARPVLLIVATDVGVDAQVTNEVRVLLASVAKNTMLPRRSSISSPGRSLRRASR